MLNQALKTITITCMIVLSNSGTYILPNCLAFPSGSLARLLSRLCLGQSENNPFHGHVGLGGLRLIWELVMYG